MRQALQDAQKPLMQMQQDMASCMSMRQNMHGGMGDDGRRSGFGSWHIGHAGPTASRNWGPLGMMCCMPGAGMHGAMGAAIMGIGALLALSVAAALIALTVFLWNRTRTARAHA